MKGKLDVTYTPYLASSFRKLKSKSSGLERWTQRHAQDWLGKSKTETGEIIRKLMRLGAVKCMTPNMNRGVARFYSANLEFRAPERFREPHKSSWQWSELWDRIGMPRAVNFAVRSTYRHTLMSDGDDFEDHHNGIR